MFVHGHQGGVGAVGAARSARRPDEGGYLPVGEIDLPDGLAVVDIEVTTYHRLALGPLEAGPRALPVGAARAAGAGEGADRPRAHVHSAGRRGGKTSGQCAGPAHLPEVVVGAVGGPDVGAVRGQARHRTEPGIEAGTVLPARGPGARHDAERTVGLGDTGQVGAVGQALQADVGVEVGTGRDQLALAHLFHIGGETSRHGPEGARVGQGDLVKLGPARGAMAALVAAGHHPEVHGVGRDARGALAVDLGVAEDACHRTRAWVDGLHAASLAGGDVHRPARAHRELAVPPIAQVGQGRGGPSGDIGTAQEVGAVVRKAQRVQGHPVGGQGALVHSHQGGV